MPLDSAAREERLAAPSKDGTEAGTERMHVHSLSAESPLGRPAVEPIMDYIPYGRRLALEARRNASKRGAGTTSAAETEGRARVNKRVRRERRAQPQTESFSPQQGCSADISMDKVARFAQKNAQVLLLQCRAEAENEWTQKKETLEAKNKELATQIAELVEENSNLQTRNDAVTRQLAEQQTQIDSQAGTEAELQALKEKNKKLKKAAAPLLVMLGCED